MCMDSWNFKQDGVRTKGIQRGALHSALEDTPESRESEVKFIKLSKIISTSLNDAECGIPCLILVGNY